MGDDAPVFEKTNQELVDELPYVWEAQGPQGRLRGINAAYELLVRWGYIDGAEPTRSTLDMESTKIVATVVAEARDRDLDLDGVILDG